MLQGADHSQPLETDPPLGAERLRLTIRRYGRGVALLKAELVNDT